MPNEEIKSEYLAGIHQQFAATRLIVDAVDMIQQGGTEGIKEIADANPEMLIFAITSLAAVIDAMQTQVLELVESRFELLDSLEALPSNKS